MHTHGPHKGGPAHNLPPSNASTITHHNTRNISFQETYRYRTNNNYVNIYTTFSFHAASIFHMRDDSKMLQIARLLKRYLFRENGLLPRNAADSRGNCSSRKIFRSSSLETAEAPADRETVSAPLGIFHYKCLLPCRLLKPLQIRSENGNICSKADDYMQQSHMVGFGVAMSDDASARWVHCLKGCQVAID